jgi:hypothetical protein
MLHVRLLRLTHTQNAELLSRWCTYQVASELTVMAISSDVGLVADCLCRLLSILPTHLAVSHAVSGAQETHITHACKALLLPLQTSHALNKRLEVYL